MLLYCGLMQQTRMQVWSFCPSRNIFKVLLASKHRDIDPYYDLCYVHTWHISQTTYVYTVQLVHNVHMATSDRKNKTHARWNVKND